MDNFVNRLEFLLETLDYTASAFADKIGVQRSSLSHLLSGRNKPSLDFILKINDTFPDINLLWLLKGKGNFNNLDNQEINIQKDIPSLTNTPISPTLFDEDKREKENNILTKKEENIESKSLTNLAPIAQSFNSNSDIDQIIIFYKDGTFSNFKPK
ncbi:MULTISPECIES: helix-turn-helix domain-containing protein [Myroides]|uniref:Helix-turn-helix domain-containing protein n=1 Tax=Myroides albus TaxID=2562892 RepID=A0A6I3LJ18_9FLAO|nr:MULTISPECIES: helix-turn-helix transcriptional regulator [Myroides]MTG97817.1 helix-turn-helix domain-containing protein [Myroides albus]MVX36830.1 helix-turn-helix domain-containing protein [Myroides sp. LoEW2-1]UVD79774.1 helix-turn-helix domain-containing protein [Myroides albus]